MKKGYTKAWRKELDSEIWLMPPLYLKVWYWLRHKVQHDPFLFPTHKGIGVWVLPGQRLTSLQEIADGVKWSEWGKEIIPNKKTILTILKWMKIEGMITVESNSQGTLISIINWHIYNHTDSTESNEKETVRKRSLDTRKECKECKEEDQKPSSSVDEVEGNFYLTKKGKKLSGQRLYSFERFWTAFGYKASKAEAADAWLAIPLLTEAIVSRIVKAAQAECARRPGIIAEGKTPKMAQGWLSGRRWEDETLTESTQLPAMRGVI